MSRFSSSLFLFVAVVGCDGNAVPASPGEDTLITFSNGRITCVAGSTCDPRQVTRMPLLASNDMAESVNSVLAYDCDPGWWLGNEQVYAFDVQSPGTVDVRLDTAGDLAAFVIALDEKYSCTAGGEKYLQVPVNPGRHWLVVDGREQGEDGAFDVELDFVSAHPRDDEFEPNDTLAQSTWMRIDDGDERTFEGVLTPDSPVDYYTFELDPISSFEVRFEGEGLSLEVVTWDGVEPRYVERSGGAHEIFQTDPYLEDWGYPVYATVTVELRMTEVGWEQGSAPYSVHAEHGYAGW